MGLFSSSRSSSSNEDNDITINNVDNAEGTGDNFNVVTTGEGNSVTNNITQTDFGAVQGGLDLAASALDSVLDLATTSANNNASLATQAAKNGSEKVLDSSTQLIGVLLIGGGLIAYALGRRK